MDDDFASADDFKVAALHDNRGAFIQTDAEQVGVCPDDRGEIVLAVARQHMLVNGRVGQEAEPAFVALGHQDPVALGCAAHQIGRQDGGTR